MRGSIAEVHSRKSGTLVLVVGPSGSGKDSIINAARAVLGGESRVHFARRAITRETFDPSEDYEGLTRARFDARAGAGEFALHWRAHNLSYAIPASILPRLEAGDIVVANVSRGIILEAERLPCDIVVAHVTASEETLRGRLRGRGRETPAEASARLSRDAPLAFHRARVVAIGNDGPLADAAGAFTALLRDLMARATPRAE